MAIEADLGRARLVVDDLDPDNIAFLDHCRRGQLRLQRCEGCRLIRYPPMGGCPYCGATGSVWVSVEAVGDVYSYTTVRHTPKGEDPYVVAIVQLDVQADRPDAEIRIAAKVVPPPSAEGPPPVPTVAIGQRMRMVFRPVNDQVTLPAWAPDEPA
ncbi:Zn-ribbon domain-containing OB-fold protein [Microbaculum marinum]|uniref:OB-fold domain-containing protein n=1 Tax=Microbaculum marinum TaxID=1764581 RepID=A0AAW9RTL9_9HYPH